MTNNVLVIGDLHLPFTLKGYIAFCKAQQKKHKCNRVIFIGDILDNHYSSYHESDPDGLGGGDELQKTIEHLRAWYKAFPKADVVIGNHDRIIMRKAHTSCIPKEWIKSYQDVLQVPRWRFQDSFEYDDVLYIHGEGVTARTKAVRESQSVVQGHRHAEGYVWFNPRRKGSYFGMQVGCGTDMDTYAMAYAKHYPSPALGCGVVLDNGRTAVFEPF
jgi:UDP-2,3-diacylglucosamine pyrophosphatase LpxH